MRKRCQVDFLDALGTPIAPRRIDRTHAPAARLPEKINLTPFSSPFS
jgi:hypothetical protein